MADTAQPVVIVRLPGSRPLEAGSPDPLPIQWTAEKERIFWQHLSKARANTGDNGGVDWQGLSTHLGVPLPYLLYRAQARYEQDLRKIQEIKPVVSPSSNRPAVSQSPGIMLSALRARSSHSSTSSHPRKSDTLSSKQTLLFRHSDRPTPSVPIISPTSSPKRHISMEPAVPASPAKRGPVEDSSSSSDSSDDDGADQAEFEERAKEQQAAMGRRLKDLERMMSSDMLGFARPLSRPPPERISSVPVNRVVAPSSPTLPESNEEPPKGELVPSIPSPPSDTRSPSNGRSSSRPKSVHHRFEASVQRQRSQTGSSQGSQASSFSDISEAGISASALEDAMLSRATGASRLSMFARSHFGARGNYS